MGSTRFRIPPALSSVLAALGTLQLRAVGILNRVDPLVSASNLYVVPYVHALISPQQWRLGLLSRMHLTSRLKVGVTFFARCATIGSHKLGALARMEHLVSSVILVKRY